MLKRDIPISLAEMANLLDKLNSRTNNARNINQQHETKLKRTTIQNLQVWLEEAPVFASQSKHSLSSINVR
jgi:hypothetical protein